MKHSKQFALSIKDIIKGFITSFLTVVITMLITVLNTGIFPTTLEQWKPILLAGLTACLAYLLKNWLTNSDNKFLIKDNESI